MATWEMGTWSAHVMALGGSDGGRHREPLLALGGVSARYRSPAAALLQSSACARFLLPTMRYSVRLLSYTA
jgi:hypothetical protein